MNPNAVVILSVRDPVARVLSDYAHYQDKHGITEALEDIIFDKDGNVNTTQNIISRGNV